MKEILQSIHTQLPWLNIQVLVLLASFLMTVFLGETTLPQRECTLQLQVIVDQMYILNINKYRTIPIAIQFLKQSHGQLDWGAMMAALVLAILPIVIFYIAGQKYIIEGVLTGAVKG